MFKHVGGFCQFLNLSANFPELPFKRMMAMMLLIFDHEIWQQGRDRNELLDALLPGEV